MKYAALSSILVPFWKKISVGNIQEALMIFQVKGDESQFGGEQWYRESTDVDARDPIGKYQ